MKYVCPKCKIAVDSEKKLTYCICGGKYQTVLPGLSEILGLDLEKDIFKSCAERPK